MERERFISINGRFLSSYVLKETDFEMAENYIAAIEHNHERCKTPQAGDVVEGAYYDGKFPYSNGIIEKIHEDGSLSICYQPYIPFIWLKKDGFIGMSVSGGPFGNHKAEELVLVEENDEAMFCDWGNCGACKDGAVNFIAPVRRWRIPYKWRSKTYVGVIDEPNEKQYPISVKELGGFGNIASFWTMEQLDRFCKTLGISYTLMQERPGYREYSMSHNFRETKGFWKLEDVPAGCTPIKLLSNGSVVDGYFRTTEHEVEIYRPNPNAKAVYKPLSIEEHITFQRENGIY